MRIGLYWSFSTIKNPSGPSPALAAQHDDNQTVSSDAQDEDEGVDHRQKDLLKVSSHHMLLIARLFQIYSEVARARTRTSVIVVVVQDDMLETNR